jgi:hypothetical protein
VSFAAITLLVASQRVTIVAVVYFFIHSVRELLNTPSYSVSCITSTDHSTGVGMRHCS